MIKKILFNNTNIIKFNLHPTENANAKLQFRKFSRIEKYSH